jgi:hypothetical protein
MSHPHPNSSDASQIERLAHELYAELIQPIVEASHNGDFLILNTRTGEFELGPNGVAATKRALARFPSAPLFTIRVGSPTAYRL